MNPKYSSYLTHGDNHTTPPHDDVNTNNTDHKRLHSHHQHHHDIRKTSSKLLFFGLIITFTFALVEGVGGYITHSIILQTDAVHMLTDAASLLIAYIANIISKRPATVNLTFGFGKAEAIGALMNCIFTLVLTIGLLFESIVRFWIPNTINGYSLLTIATLGLIANVTVAFILSHGLDSLNTKAAFIHAIGDIIGSIVAIIAGAVISLTNFHMIDPILSLVLIMFLMISNYNIIKKSIIVLMAGVPEHLNYQQIGKDLEMINGIVSIHDLDIWYMSTNKTALSAHIIAKNPLSWQETLTSCQEMLMNKYHIEHITLQHEFDVSNHHHCS